MKHRILLTSILFLTIFVARSQDHLMHLDKDNTLQGQHETHLTSGGPIAVMGDHMHHKGSLMFSYRYMAMNMDGAIRGNKSIDDAEVLNEYNITPQTMTMGMHMIGAMYALTDQVTVMGMGGFLAKNMLLQTRMNTEFTTESHGLADLNVSVLVKVADLPKSNIHGILGLGLPTGSTNERDQTPMAEDALLAYPMQLGSGTWDPFIGLNYTGHSRRLLWGAQGRYQHRLGQNRDDYNLGNKMSATAWGALKAGDNLNFSLRTAYLHSRSIDGFQKEMNPRMMPLFDAKNSGQEQISLHAGINSFINQGSLLGLRLGIEAGYVGYQKATGIQMRQKMQWTIGVQYVFGGKH